MGTIKAGIVSQKELEGTMNSDAQGNLFDLDAPSTWALIWFLVAVVLLFVL